MQRICLSLVLGLVLVGTADAQKGGGKTKYTVDVTVSGSGLVTSSTGGISCPGACSISVNSGTSITFTATSDQGATFTGWAGDCAGTSTTCSLTISAPTSVSATFEGGGGGGGGDAPTITEVYFDTVSSPATLTAIGTNFDVSTTATLGANLLSLDGTNGTAYTAFLPAVLADGDYLLTLTNAAGSATWQLTYPAVGPAGPQGDPGADGTDGVDGANCSVTQQDGGALIACDDGSTAALADGQDGSNGTDGASCSVTQLDGGAVISCDGGTTATLADGQDGEQGPEGLQGPQGEPGPASVLSSGGSTFAGQPTNTDTSRGGDSTAFGAYTLTNLAPTTVDDRYGNPTGWRNSAFGFGAMSRMTLGSGNTALGALAMNETLTGGWNIAIGEATMQYNSSGWGNTAVGRTSLMFSNGDRNIALGEDAGNNLRTGSRNIYIGSRGGTEDESDTLRIGSSQNRAFITGIRNLIPDGTLHQVVINENGQLGSRDLDVSQLIIDGADNTGAGRGALGPLNTGRLNTFLGTFTLGSNTVGEVNTAIGNVALEQNTSGYRNTAIGSGAMRLNLTGRDNLAIGVDALYTAEDTCCNAAIGPWALKNLQYGYGNTALGHYAGSDLISGIGNLYLQHPGVAEEDNTIRIGQGQNRAFVAGVRDVTIGGDVMQVVINGEGQLGSSPIASISDAWDSQGSFWLYPNGGSNNNSSGANNVALGSLGMLDNTTGAGNVSIGHYAMQYNTSGSNNVALGNGALYFSPGNSNTAIGIRAGTFLQEGSGNTYIASEGANSESNTLRIGSVYGFDEIPRTSRAFIAGIRGVTPDGSLQQVVINENGQLGSTTASAISANGESTSIGNNAYNANSADQRITAYGASALASNTTGYQNVAVGTWALQQNTGGYDNTAVGFNALGAVSYGYQNTAVGFGANLQNSIQNTAVGYQALANNTAAQSTAVGFVALGSSTTGTYNTALGTGAASSFTTGSFNTAVGWAAMGVLSGFANRDGDSNTAIGIAAGSGLDTGSRNIFLGANSGTYIHNGSDNIQIGNPGIIDENGTIRIGQFGTHSAAFLAGIYGTSVVADSGATVVVDNNGQLGTVMSSARFKHDIQDMEGSSDRLYELRPVTYYYNQAAEKPTEGKLQYGLIAEEVADILPNLVVYGQDGRPDTVAYHALIPMLLNEIQKQNRRLAVLETELSELKAGAIAEDRLMAKASSVRTANEGDE